MSAALTGEHGASGRWAAYETIYSALLSPPARPESSRTRAMRRTRLISTRGGRSCGARRGCRPVYTDVRVRTHQKAPWRRSLDVQLLLIVHVAHVVPEAAVSCGLQRTRPRLSSAPCSVAEHTPPRAAPRPKRLAAALCCAYTKPGVRFFLRRRAALGSAECTCDQAPAADAAPRRPARSTPRCRARTLL